MLMTVLRAFGVKTHRSFTFFKYCSTKQIKKVLTQKQF